MLSAAAAFLATAAGKVAAGTAIAAVSVGGLAATDVIELPTQADADRPTEVDTVDAQDGEQGERGDDGRADDAGTQGLDNAPDDLPVGAEAGQGFAADMQAWAQCVAEAAAAQGDEGTRTTEGFDPSAACDPRPAPPTDEGDDAGTGLEGADNAGDRQPETPEVADERGPEAADQAPVPSDADDAGSDDAPAPQADAGAGNAPAGTPTP